MSAKRGSARDREAFNDGDTLPDVLRSTAVRLFREHGYARVTIDDIVREVGVTKGAFYHYYDSKSTLLFELHTDYVDFAIARLQRALDDDSDPAVQVRAYIREVFAQIHEHGEYVQLLFDERRELPADKTPLIEKKKDVARKMLERVIERGVTSGAFEKNDVGLTAHAVSGMALWGYQWYEGSGRVSHEKIADAFADLVLCGLQRDPR